MADEPIIKKRPRRSARSRQQLNLLVFALAMVACITAAALYLLMPDKEGFVLKSYRYTEVSERSFRQLVTAEGTVIPRVTSNLTASAAGTVVQLPVKAGQDVSEGDVLCVIDSPSLMAKLDQVTKDLHQARVDARKLDLDSQVKILGLEVDLLAAEHNMNEAERMLEVWEHLYLLGDVSKSDLENRKKAAEDARRKYESLALTYEATVEKHKFDVESANSRVEELERQLRELQEDVDSLVVRAPLTGRVLDVAYAEGDRVQENAVLLTIADLSSSYISAQVPVSALSSVRVGQPVTVSMLGERYSGTVSYIAPQAAISATTVALEVALHSVPDNVIPKAACYLEIEVARKDAANSLPRDHYLTSGGSMYIYVLDLDTCTARKVPARFGLVDGGYVELLSGAQKGDLVIVSSYDEFIDRDEITVSEGGGTLI
ncbi:MAG: efflux RND transporter periplasmic adaptor subunit [Bacillota bacterium]|nr:HlyD family efflux transporter periplasmic adaptor subunit [Bacillota bacterium]HOB92412.1 efflux RND transporter periplasmic adaptor subunit [Bacillota bacterium]HPZ55570.1 efflux RND transporter periplasmic adaptor subunit [Bacillota bacterium]HQD19118.1 efflux RND transporter periplasmic adaptor subunit [Bacillota bacterium]